MNIIKSMRSTIMRIVNTIVIAIMAADNELEVEESVNGFGILVESGKQRGRLLRSDEQPEGKI